jgi:hypothetical protein
MKIKLAFFLLLLLAIAPIIANTLRGTLSDFSFSVVKLSQDMVLSGHYVQHPLEGVTGGLASEINIRSEWAATPILLTVFSLISGISPFDSKMLPFGLLLIPAAWFLAKRVNLKGYWAVVFAIIVGFSSEVIALNDYSQFALSWLFLFLMLGVWSTFVQKSQSSKSSAILLFLLFFVTLETHAAPPGLFLAFATATFLLQYRQSVFPTSHSIDKKIIRLPSYVLASLWLLFLNKMFFQSSVIDYYYSSKTGIFGQLLSAITRQLNLIYNELFLRSSSLTALNPRSANPIVTLTSVLSASLIGATILFWLLSKKTRKFPWTFIGYGIFFMIISEYLIYNTTGMGWTFSFPRTYFLFGTLISLYVTNELFRKTHRLKIIAVIIVLGIVSSQFVGWTARIYDDRTYNSMHSITDYSAYSPVAQFSVIYSNSGQRIFATSEVGFLVLGYSNMDRASDIRPLKSSWFESSNFSSLNPSSLIVFSTLYGSVKSLYFDAFTVKPPSESYVKILNNSTELDLVYDNGQGLIYSKTNGELSP